MRHARRTCLAALAMTAMVLSVARPALAQAETSADTAGSGTNVRLTFRLGTIEDGKRIPVKSYNLVVASGALGSRLLSGERVPFPATTAEDDEQGRKVVYQNVGFHTEARAWILDDGGIKLVAEIEDSRVVEGEGEEPPTVETRQLNVSAILADGVPLELTRVEGLTDQSGFVDVVARILE